MPGFDKAPKAFGLITIIADGQYNPLAIAVHASYVCWPNTETATQTWLLDGTIVRLAK